MTVYFLVSGKCLTLENKSSQKINQKLLSASVKGDSLTPSEGLGWPGLIRFFVSTYSGETALKAVREKECAVNVGKNEQLLEGAVVGECIPNFHWVTILTMSLPAPHFTLSSEPCRVFQVADLGRSTAKTCRSDGDTLTPQIWAEEGPQGALPTNQIQTQFFKEF